MSAAGSTAAPDLLAWSHPARSDPLLTAAADHRQTVRELSWLIAGLPLWWMLGIEQLVWPLGSLWAARRVLLGRNADVRLLNTAWWLAALTLAFLVSAFAVSDALRWITFLRTLVTYVTAFLTVATVVTAVRRWEDVALLLRSVAFAAGLIVVLGLLAATDVWRPDFTSPLGHLLPGALLQTDYGQQVATRVLGFDDWFTGVGSYYRLRGIALYPNQYATFLLVAYPVTSFLAWHATSMCQRLLYGTIALAVLTNLVLTTSRVALASLLCGGAAYLLVYSPYAARFRRLALVMLALSVAGVVAAASISSSQELSQHLSAVVAEAGYARGPGSIEGRSAVYEATLAGWRERPLFGWGTERDVPGVPYPAGSHSHYLGVLYAQGGIGLLLFVAAIVSVWRDSAPVMAAAGQEIDGFLRYGRWLLIAAVLDATTNNASLDGTSMFFLWLAFSLLLAARQLLPARLESLT